MPDARPGVQVHAVNHGVAGGVLLTGVLCAAGLGTGHVGWFLGAAAWALAGSAVDALAGARRG